MRERNRQVHLWVSEAQHAAMRAKARGYGITLSRLVLVAVEAYARTYGELAEGEAVAVNYGAWRRVDAGLSGAGRALSEVARQLAGTRRALVRGRAKPLDGAEAALLVAGLEGCLADVARTRACLERCAADLDLIRESALLVDPYLGPMERGAADGAAGLPEGGR